MNLLSTGLKPSPEQFSAIPQELQQLPQFCVWKYEDGSKTPYQLNGKLAKVNDPSTWCSFEEAVEAAHRFDGIMFALTENDPYALIDLDAGGDAAQQNFIFEKFNSYSEISPPGQGLHIIIKAKVPSGRKRNKVEIYSSKRFVCFTGNVYVEKPIAERQHLATILWEQMGGAAKQEQTYHGDPEEHLDDNEVIQRALNASNADLFKPLHEGRWQEARRRDGSSYPSQSEADFAFMNIVAFHSRNRNQVARLFCNSALGKVPKPGNRKSRGQRTDYVEKMLNRVFDNILPPIDFEGLNEAHAAMVATQAAASQAVAPCAHNQATITESAAASGPACKPPAQAKAASAEKSLVLKCVADVQPEHIRWLWRKRFALGKVSMVAGDPGLGKSQLMAKIAACVSIGAQWPDGSGNAPIGSVIMLSCEDDIADTIRPRLEAVNANIEKIAIVEAVADAKGIRGVSLIEDIHEIEKVVVQRRDVKLLIVDPITAYLDKIDSHRTSDVRNALAPLQILANKHKIAIIIVSHFNKKSGNGKAINAFTGSGAFVAAVRAAFIVTKGQEDDEGLRLFLQAKNNLANAPGLAFQVREKVLINGITAPYIEFEKDIVDVTADEILSIETQGRKPIARNDAEEFLREVLKDGPVPASSVKEQAEAQGIKYKTLQRAKETLGVKSVKQGLSEWVWELPQNCSSTGIFSANKGLN